MLAAPSETPRTVTRCGAFQFDAVKRSVVGETVATASSELVGVTSTVPPVGAAASVTEYAAIELSFTSTDVASASTSSASSSETANDTSTAGARP